MQYYDMHCYSQHSYGAVGAVSKVCQWGIRAGLSGVAITDKLNIEENSDNGLLQFEKSLVDIVGAKDRYDGKLRVMAGVELFDLYENLEVAMNVYSDQRLDFALASMDVASGAKPNSELSDREITEFYESYYTRMYEIACTAAYDSIAHFNNPIRYGFTLQNKSFFDDIVNEIFKEVALKDKAIELNTSVFELKGHSLPEIRELKMFKAVGGRFVTVGSSANTYFDVGKDIKKGVYILQMAGFEKQTIFMSHKPKEILLR